MTRFGTILLALGLAILVDAWVLGGVIGWLGAWAGSTFLAVGVAYLVRFERVFGKRTDGTLALARVILLFPFLAMTWVVWHLRRLVSREPASHVLRPDLLISRRLLAGELPDGVAVVLDLTAEFPDPTRALASTYHNLCILDAGVPDRRELARTIAGLPTGTVLVHCAQGHGRTAMVAACMLIAREQLTPDAAIAAVLAVRPRARMNRNQLALVRAFAEGR